MRKPKGAEPRRASLCVGLTMRMMFQLTMVERYERESRVDIITRALEAMHLENIQLERPATAGLDKVCIGDLWDPSPAVRLFKLATKAPGLMSGPEKRFLESLKAHDKYWCRPELGGCPPTARKPEHLLADVLQEDWEQLDGPHMAATERASTNKHAETA